MIHLRSSLVKPLRPSFAPILRDNHTLVAGQRNNPGIVWVDENVLVVVAARGSAQAVPRLAGVGRLPGNDAGHVDRVGIFGINLWHWHIATADAGFGARIVDRRMDPVPPPII